ncbi:MAG: hypothetical protein JAZ17_05580 [Candidatus Thiodiazotropha endolucinida]|nr:hypothetical protein [Candidatus Thiodiazotropha endolucinida]
MDTVETIVLGVVSGVFSSVVMYWLTLFVTRVLIPEYRAAIYKGLELNGSWVIEQSDIAADQEGFDVKTKTVVTLSQKGTDLKGSASSTDENQDRVTMYDVEGQIRDRFVLLSLYVKDRKRIGYQTFLLEVVADGQVMEGYRTVYGLLMKKVRAVECTLTRQVNNG